MIFYCTFYVNCKSCYFFFMAFPVLPWQSFVDSKIAASNDLVRILVLISSLRRIMSYNDSQHNLLCDMM